VSERSSPSNVATARQHFVQDHAKRPHVAALVRHATFGLLGAHVGGRAQDHAGNRPSRRRQCRRLRYRAGWLVGARRLWRHEFCQPEIEHFHRAILADLDVGRLEIAMNDSLRVCGLERLRNPLRDDDGLGLRNRPLRDPLGQRRSVNQLHDQRMNLIGVLESVDVRDVGMIERGQHLSFSLEAG
jgi:hypothetical protein